MTNRFGWALGLFFTGFATNVAAAASDVFAAWSQVIGQSDVASAGAPATALVEMRFVTSAPMLCDQFLVHTPNATPAEVMQHGEKPVARPVSFSDIGVCRQPLTGEQAQLYDATGVPVLLSSKSNLGNKLADLTDPDMWKPGASNGKKIIVAGPDWIGRSGSLITITLGDTGCRGGHRQTCDTWQGSTSWPFAKLAQLAAERQPDLVIHVGDYRYFEENQITDDSWTLWQKDFFPLAQPLLLAAPWAFARGNHEGCPTGAALQYGVGYFQFFGQEDLVNCANLTGKPLKLDTAAPIYRSPWYFDIAPMGGAASDTHRFVMIDANDYEGSIGVSQTQAQAHFEDAIAITGAGPALNWWVWHSPAVQRINWHQQPFGDPTLRSALLAAAGAGKSDGARFCYHATAPACRPSLFLLGHQHLYQDVSFPKAGNTIFPKSVIVGHGGVTIRSSSPGQHHEEFCQEGDFPLGANQARDVHGVVNTVEEHGLVAWTRAAGAPLEGIGWMPSYLWTRNIMFPPGRPMTATWEDTPALPQKVDKCLTP